MEPKGSMLNLQGLFNNPYPFFVLILISILLNIMFHAPMGRFRLEVIDYFTYFSTVIPSNICMLLSCRLLVINTAFSTGLVGVEVTTGKKYTNVG